MTRLRALALAWGLSTACGGESGPAPDFDALELQGRPIVQAIERFEGEHGRPPGSLEECGQSAPDTPFGPWQYALLLDGSWTLGVGEYSRHGFALYWAHEHGWYRDT